MDVSCYCPLCEARAFSVRFYEDDLLWAARCMTCGDPMAVLKRHATEPTEEENRRLCAALMYAAAKVWPNQSVRIDKVHRSIKDHLHWHARLVEVADESFVPARPGAERSP